MTVAVVFPGQGSQSVGMLDDFDQPVVMRTLEEASDALGWGIADLIKQGPETTLNQTQYTQPAILAASIALWRLAGEHVDLQPSVMAGHSLGEYSALVAAGSLALADALRLVEARGRYMQEFAPAGAGMVALLGMEDEAVAELCAAHAEGGLYPVNFNAPGQVVVAGLADALDWLEANAREAGARKATRLSMSVPSHCVLLERAAEALNADLEAISLAEPAVPVLHNIDVEPRESASAIRKALRAQLCEPVRWTQTQQALLDRGVTQVVECGPGKVLAGLAKRGMKGARCISIGSAAGLSELSGMLGAKDGEATA